MNIWVYLKQYLLKHGNNVAFVYRKTQVTYAELINMVEQPNGCDGIVICDEKDRLNQIISMLRCFYNKNICIPVNFDYGEVYNKNIREMVYRNAEERIPNDVAMIMFTSGSTGVPKGAMLTHENIISNLMAINGYMKLDSSDKILVSRSPMHVAVFTGEILVGLYSGATIYLYDEQMIPQRLLKFIRQNEISVFANTPTIVSLLCRYIEKENFIKKLIVSGECLAPTIAKIIAQKFPNAQIYSVYGLTEASPRVSALSPELFVEKVGSVGYPISGVEIKIIDNNGETIDEAFVDGRIIVKSPGVMVGYWAQNDLTSQKIIDGWLHTGDVGYFDKDGCLYIKGRSDNMLIRGGINIYPEEIESLLRVDERIHTVNCYMKDGGSVKLLYLDVSGEITNKELQELIIKVLPLHMRPNVCRIVTEQKLTASGKTLRG